MEWSKVFFDVPFERLKSLVGYARNTLWLRLK